MADRPPDLTAAAAEKPADCLRVIARVWETSQPLGRAEMLALLPIVEIAYQNLDTFRFHLVNLIGCQGVKLEKPTIQFTTEPPSIKPAAPPDDLLPDGFRR